MCKFFVGGQVVKLFTSRRRYAETAVDGNTNPPLLANSETSQQDAAVGPRCALCSSHINLLVQEQEGPQL